MIKIDGEVVNIGSFPDGTALIKYKPFPSMKMRGYTKIAWYYENDTEMIALMYIVKHLRSHQINDIYLYMPYIPNARMDRVKNPEDVFTLKYFAEFINNLNFTSVEVLDPHSSVSEALINNLCVVPPVSYITRVLGDINKGNILMFYPDEGARKRYGDLVNLPCFFGIKRRDWKTGSIEGLDVSGPIEFIPGKDILIVDDICSRGGTFLHSAKKLKELGAKDIYLYISHCENTILEGDLLKGDLIKKVYTTDSIFTKNHEKIEVLK